MMLIPEATCTNPLVLSQFLNKEVTFYLFIYLVGLQFTRPITFYTNKLAFDLIVLGYLIRCVVRC